MTTARPLPEWIGRKPTSKIPDQVKDRIRQRQGNRCAISDRPFAPGDLIEFDHKIPLRDWTADGHGNRESNLQAILSANHRVKTAIENSRRAKEKRIRQKHFGLKSKSRGFEKPAGVKFNWAKGRYERAE